MITRTALAAIALGLCIFASGCGNSAEKQAAEAKAAEAKATAERKTTEQRAAAEKKALAEKKADVEENPPKRTFSIEGEVSRNTFIYAGPDVSPIAYHVKVSVKNTGNTPLVFDEIVGSFFPETGTPLRIAKLTDQALLAQIAEYDSDWNVRQAALSSLSDQSLLAQIAQNGGDRNVCQAALGKLTDQSLLAQIAQDFCDSDIMIGSLWWAGRLGSASNAFARYAEES